MKFVERLIFRSDAKRSYGEGSQDAFSAEVNAREKVRDRFTAIYLKVRR